MKKDYSELNNTVNKKIDDLMERHISDGLSKETRINLEGYICSKESGCVDVAYNSFKKKYYSMVKKLDCYIPIYGEEERGYPAEFLSHFYSALFKLVDAYDASKGIKFSIYFWKYIVLRILDEIEKENKNRDNCVSFNDKDKDSGNELGGLIEDESSTAEFDMRDTLLNHVHGIKLITSNINRQKHQNLSNKEKKALYFWSMIQVNTIGVCISESDSVMEELKRDEETIFKSYDLGFVDFLYSENSIKCRTLVQQKNLPMRLVEKAEDNISVPKDMIGKSYTYPLHNSAYLNYCSYEGRRTTYNTLEKYKNEYENQYKEFIS